MSQYGVASPKCPKGFRPVLWICLAIAFALAGTASAQGSRSGGATQRFKVVPAGPKDRVIGHQEAYTKRNIVGGHVNVKITPPEKRGKSGRVAVEVYNYSPVYLSIVDFWMELETTGMFKIDGKVKVENLKQNWGDIVWIEIPPKYANDFPPISKVKISNLKMYDDKARQVKVPLTTDLIKY